MPIRRQTLRPPNAVSLTWPINPIEGITGTPQYSLAFPANEMAIDGGTPHPFYYSGIDVIHVWYWNRSSRARVHYQPRNILRGPTSLVECFDWLDIRQKGTNFNEGLIRIERGHLFATVWRCAGGCAHRENWRSVFRDNRNWISSSNPPPDVW